MASLKSTAIIGNKYYDILNKYDVNAVSSIKGQYDLVRFKTDVLPAFKQQYLGIIIIDATCVPNCLIEALEYLKSNIDVETRIVVLAPNLKDEVIITKIYTYGIYDLINPELDEGVENYTIQEDILQKIRWAVEEPTTFAKIKDKLEKVYKEKDAPPVTVESLMAEIEAKFKAEESLKKTVKQNRILAILAIIQAVVIILFIIALMIK